LPLVRLSRDKRGFDTIYLLDAGSGRQGKLRVLYFWTAPTGIRVGRDALDDVRRQQLERAFPQVPFDWPALLASLATARQQAALFAANEARREAWRGSAKAGKSARVTARATDQDEEAGVPPAGTDRAEPAVAPAATPTDRADAASETPGEPPRVARRRKKRARRPRATGDAPSTPSAPIIET
jgi:hypothetical protein